MFVNNPFLPFYALGKVYLLVGGNQPRREPLGMLRATPPVCWEIVVCSWSLGLRTAHRTPVRHTGLCGCPKWRY